MVVKIVRYILQQGTGKIVVLVPYLAQLRDLRDAFRAEHDPIIHELDAYDLTRAGVPPTACGSERPIHLATIGIDF